MSDSISEDKMKEDYQLAEVWAVGPSVRKRNELNVVGHIMDGP